MSTQHFNNCIKFSIYYLSFCRLKVLLLPTTVLVNFQSNLQKKWDKIKLKVIDYHFQKTISSKESCLPK